MVKIEFATGNAAFADDEKAAIAQILRGIAARLDDGRYVNKIYDENGNSIGTFTWERETEIA